MTWYAYALLGSFFNAVALESIAHFKVDSLKLTFGTSVAIFFILLPTLFLVPLPEDISFYLLGLFIGFLSVYADIKMFDLAKVYGSRAVSIYTAMKILLVFVCWQILFPSSFLELTAEPLIAAGIIACLAITCFSVYLMSNHSVSWAVLVALIPVAAVLAVGDISTKLGIQAAGDAARTWESAALFVWLVGIGNMVISGPMQYLRGDKENRYMNRYDWSVSIGLGALYVLVLISTVSAQLDVPNPAYVNAIVVLGLVWLLIYHKMRGTPDTTNPAAALLFVLSAAGIILLTS